MLTTDTTRAPRKAAPKPVTWKGMCTVHDSQAPESQELKDWFYRELSAALNPDDPDRAAAFRSFLDSPRRVILEVEPTQRIAYDGAKMRAATAEWIARS